MTEEWIPINGFDGKYSVSNFGAIRNNKRNKMLRTKPKKSGYVSVNLYKNGKPIHLYVHRIVAKAFLENPALLPDVNHMDGDKANNIVTNLEWASEKENAIHSVHVLGNPSPRGSIKVLCVNTGKIYDSIRLAGGKTGTPYSSIYRSICTGKTDRNGVMWKKL